jgi:hypothetical protein
MNTQAEISHAGILLKVLSCEMDPAEIIGSFDRSLLKVVSRRFFRKSAPTLGAFNVSNLMGITRRMIDIGKKISFYFLLNV